MSFSQYSCLRCRKQKKKCSRELPICSHCFRVNTTCEYIDRKNKKKDSHPHGHAVSPAESGGHDNHQTPLVSNNPTQEESNAASSLYHLQKSGQYKLQKLNESLYLPPLAHQYAKSSLDHIPFPSLHSNPNSPPSNSFPRQTHIPNTLSNSLYGQIGTTPQSQSQPQTQNISRQASLPAGGKGSPYYAPPLQQPSPGSTQLSTDPSELPLPPTRLPPIGQHQQPNQFSSIPLQQQPQQHSFSIPMQSGVSQQKSLSIPFMLSSEEQKRSGSVSKSPTNVAFLNTSLINNNSSHNTINHAHSLNSNNNSSISSVSTVGSRRNSEFNRDSVKERERVGSIPPESVSLDAVSTNVLRSLISLSSPGTPPAEPLLLNKDIAFQFINAYLEHNHRSYPFLNKQEFIRKIEKLDFESLFDMNNKSSSLIVIDPSLTFEVSMIMAIGCTTLERAGIIQASKGYSKFFSSVSLRLLNKVVNYKDFDSVRSLLLLAIYSFFDPKGTYSWSIVGVLTRLTISLGLNRKVRELESRKMTVVEIEMRYRLFWAVYNMDRLISVSLGRPVSIRDEDINVPLPTSMHAEEAESVKLTNSIIEMRRIEGQILTEVHSVSAGQKYKTDEEKQAVIDKLRREVEVWSSQASAISPKVRRKDFSSISFHGSTSWVSARYYHILMLLYRPSYLFPNPTLQKLEALGKYCLQNLSHTYSLFTSNMLPLNWITLYRFLTTCTTILYCLCQWTIDLVESKTDIHLCIEILDAFSENWVFAKRCAQVFKSINDTILEISLGGKNNKISDVDKLMTELMGASSSYHEILFDNSVDIWYDDTFRFAMSGHANEQVMENMQQYNKKVQQLFQNSNSLKLKTGEKESEFASNGSRGSSTGGTSTATAATATV